MVMVMMPSRCNDLHVQWVELPGTELQGQKPRGTWKRQEHLLAGRAGLRACSTPLTSPSSPTHCLHSELPATHLSGGGAQRTHLQEVALKTLQQT